MTDEMAAVLREHRERMRKIDERATAQSEMLATENIRNILTNADVSAKEKYQLGRDLIDKLVEKIGGQE